MSIMLPSAVFRNAGIWNLLAVLVVLRTTEPSTAFAARNRKGKSNQNGTPNRKGFGVPSSKSSPSPAFTPDTSENIQNLFQFLENEECEGFETLQVGTDNGSNDPLLRGVFATQDIPAGAYICAIPFPASLLIDEEFIPSNSDTNNMNDYRLSASQIEKGKLFLDNFMKAGNEPPPALPDTKNDNPERWKAYLDSIPLSMEDPNFTPTPDFWTDDEIRLLEVPRLVQEILSRTQELHKFVGPEQLLNNELQMACWVVQTRAFTTLKAGAVTLDGTMGLLQRTVLIPLLDMINHSSRPNAELQVVETKAYDESFYALVATRRIVQGEQVRIRYGSGEETSLDLFAKYGFLPKTGGNQDNDRKAIQEMGRIAWSRPMEEDLSALPAATGIERDVLSLHVYWKELEKSL